MICRSLRFFLAGVVSIAVCLATVASAEAQCSTCAAPTVAYQPTAAYPQVVAYQRARVGLFDRWRMRRWGVTPVQPVYATTYAAPRTAAYTPYQAAYAYTPTSYTAAYAPAVSTTAYRPYVTSYAPLARTTSYTVARPVVMSPIVSTCSACGCEPCACAQPACASCDACGSCSSCSACSTGVGQAIYTEPASSCPTCAPASGVPSSSSTPSVGPATPQPQLSPNEGAPSGSTYESNRLEIDEQPTDPSPSPEADSTYFEAPKLFSPRDRTANRPTVDIHDAVYRREATYRDVSQTSAEVDANGWYAVSGDR